MKTFAIDPEGDFYAADAIDAVRRWKGHSGTGFIDAGVPAPATALTLSAAGTGPLVGRVFGYYRYLDSDGRPGNVSPVSAAYEFEESSGTITGATNASPIVVTSTAHGLSNDDRVKISGVAGNVAANGLWRVKNVAANTFELYEEDGTTKSIGSGAYVSGGEWVRGELTLTYASMDAGYPDSRAVRTQILRTKDGDATVAYIDYDSTTHPGTSEDSTDADSALGDPVVLLDLSNDDAASAIYTEPPDYKPFLASVNGRMIYAGDACYRLGSVAVTNGSPTVTGQGTAWTSEMEGRYLHVAATSKAFLISSVNTTAQTLTLSENYSGATAVAHQYTIRPDAANRRTVLWSEAGRSDGVDPSHALTLPENPTAGEVTGLCSHQRWAYVFCEMATYRLSFQDDPATDGYLSHVLGRGCVNNRCWVIVDDAIYALDRQGVYAFSGADVAPVSDLIRTMFEPGSGGEFEIRWEWKEHFHAVHDPENAAVLFFVSLTGGRPRHALAYRYRTRQWDLLEYPVAITSSCLGMLRGRPQVYGGSTAREVLALNTGSSDGTADRPDLRGTATSAGLYSLTDSSASFPSDVVNGPLDIVSGRGKGQRRRIVEVDGTTLRISHPWTVLPDATSEYQLGGVKYRWLSGWKRWAQKDTAIERGLELVYQPTSREGRLDLTVLEDVTDSPLSFGRTRRGSDEYGMGVEDGESGIAVETTKSNGTARLLMGSTKEARADGPRFVAVEAEGVTNAEPQRIYQLAIDGAVG